ncbi:hypothetical protein BDP27DRAFT_1403094 [Rhodocollybia butyracea]|uniref:Uncharacterized protein n=1 Tax=Rhodocollybia butyracea TaxID=206335 RepID=A0A9P5U7D6_9AGAR|nr:hypothetical protein BDP27DRAFT_1403094 [Rhodocollybia butyracea]
MFFASNRLYFPKLDAYTRRIPFSLPVLSLPSYESSHRLYSQRLAQLLADSQLLTIAKLEFSQLSSRERDDLLKLSSLGLGIVIFSCILLLLWVAAQKKTSVTHSIKYTAAISPSRHQIHRILSMFLVPTPTARSRFPTDFLRHTTTGIVELDLVLLLTGMASGKLELREIGAEKNPLDSLVLLLKGTLEVDGYKLRIKVGKKMWAKVSSWIVLGSYSDSQPAVSTVQTVLNLDLVPYASLERTLKSFVHSTCSGGRCTVEFSVLAPHLRCLSDHFVLCAVPFIYSAYGSTFRMPTPMLLTLERVVEILSSSCSSPPSVNQNGSMQILSCMNTSVEYASSLYELAQENYAGTEDHSWQWTERRTLLLWKAALVKVGWVQRWVVVVSK